MRLGVGGGLGLGRGGPAWSPTLLASRTAWYAPDSLTIVSTKVTAWGDKSASGFNLAQASDALQPTVVTRNGLKGTAFTAASSTLLVGNAPNVHAGAFTIAVALRVSIVEAGTWMVSTVGSNFAGGVALVNGANREISYPLQTTAADGAETTSAEVWVVSGTGTTTNFYVNGAAQSVPQVFAQVDPPGSGAQVALGAFAGGSLPSSVEIYEVIICNAVLGASDTASVTAYLRSKFAI